MYDERDAMVQRRWRMKLNREDVKREKGGIWLLTPIHTPAHWSLMATNINFETREMSHFYYDSLPRKNSDSDKIFRIVNSHMLDFTVYLFNGTDHKDKWNVSFHRLHSYPKQKNSSDCGVFVINAMANIAFFLNSNNHLNTPNYNQQHIYKLRQVWASIIPGLVSSMKRQ